jgi:hypothetical protein
MPPRSDRLKKLVEVQEQLKALHEARHAAHRADSAKAREDATDLARRAGAENSLSQLFPGLYERKIEQALTRMVASRKLARKEVDNINQATLRTNMVERAYREAAGLEEREIEDKERLEIIGRKKTERK